MLNIRRWSPHWDCLKLRVEALSRLDPPFFRRPSRDSLSCAAEANRVQHVLFVLFVLAKRESERLGLHPSPETSSLDKSTVLRDLPQIMSRGGRNNLLIASVK